MPGMCGGKKEPRVRPGLSEADLSRANLIDACLDGANLTGAKLWETQRGGWSIKNVICQVAFWDRDGKEPTKYEEGEFERIFAEKPRIILRYAGGISPNHEASDVARDTDCLNENGRIQAN